MKFTVQHYFRYKLAYSSFEHDKRYDKEFATRQEAEDYIKNDNSYVGSDMSVRHEIKVNEFSSCKDMKNYNLIRPLLDDISPDFYPRKFGPWCSLTQFHPPFSDPELEVMRENGVIEFDKSKERFRLTIKSLDYLND